MGGAIVADWYVLVDGQTRGPGSLDELRALLRRTDPAHLFVWRAGFDDWTLASEVPELSTPPAPPQSPVPHVQTIIPRTSADVAVSPEASRPTEQRSSNFIARRGRGELDHRISYWVVAHIANLA